MEDISSANHAEREHRRTSSTDTDKEMCDASEHGENIENEKDEEGEEEYLSSHDIESTADRTTPRHSYDYARNPSPSRPQLTRSRTHTSIVHDSVLTTVARLRNRDPATRFPFKHPLADQKTPVTALVEFDGKDDPYRPINWPFRKKVWTTLLYGFTTFGTTFASSVYTSGIQEISAEFHVSTIVANLGTSFMLFGFGLGPLIWAPLSELYGRKSIILLSYFVAAVFCFGTGAAKDIQTVLITRFFRGFFGSAPITNTGGVLGDIWSAQQRGMALVGYAIAVVGGPTVGPVIGGAIVQSYLGWRWTEYLTGIIMFAILLLDLLLLDESFAPALLVHKAQRLRHETGNWSLHAQHEEWDASLGELSRKYLIRPFKMLTTPICLLIAIYASFVYGILYGNLSALPIEYQENRGWGQVKGSLPFLAVLVGVLVGGAANVFNNKYYFRRFVQNGNRAVPEARLPPMMIGSIFFAAGLFLFGWTSDPSISAWPSIIGMGMTGLGFFTIFQAALNYLVDTFTKYGASAIAANTFLRSMFAGAFPLFVEPMYHNLGVDWASTLLGCIAAAAIPVPFLFFIYGKRIRARGEYSRDSV